MLSKDQFLAMVDDETRILKHLHGKLSSAHAGYRPSPQQRSTLELLRYLSMCGTAAARAMVDNGWTAYAAIKERADGMTFEQFPEALDRQSAEIRAILGDLTEADLSDRTATYPTGEVLPLGFALVMSVARWLTAYRMQLFLYAKATDAPDLNTANLWGGRDPQPKA